jgi:hypothetical protein
MNATEYDPRRWATSGAWAVESQDAALARAPDFGRRFFSEIFGQFPALAADALFLRWSAQPDDVYAVFGHSGGGLGVQVDPYLQYVIIRGRTGHAEYGNWDADQVPPAVEHVRRLMGRSPT